MVEIEIDNAYDDKAQRLKYLNKQIKDRLVNVVGKFYVVKYVELVPKEERECYAIYRKPKFELDLTGSLCFNAINAVSKRYYITSLYVEDNVVINYADNPRELAINTGLLQSIFNSIEDDDVEIKIIKNYCDWEFK